jgi:opacity protein-like surface antigen
MLLRLVVPALLLAGCSTVPTSAPPPVASGDDNHFTLLLGGRELEDSSAEQGDVYEQGLVGLQLDHPALLLAERSTVPTSAPPPVASVDDNHITLLMGGRKLEDSSAERGDVDKQPLLGLEMDHYDEDGNGIEYGVTRSQNHDHIENFKVGADLTELYVGYRRTFRENDEVQPFVSIGGAAVHGDIDFGTGEDDDGWTPCAYVRLGLMWTVGDGTRLGLDYRHQWGTFHFSGENFDAGYDQVAFSLGFGF